MANEVKAIKTCAAFKLGAAVAESDSNALDQFRKLIKVGMPYAQYKVEATQFRLGYETKSDAKSDELREQAARQAWSRLMRKAGLTRDAKTGVSVAEPKTSAPRNNGKKAATKKGATGATMKSELETMFGKDVAEYIKKHATVQGEIIRLVESRISVDAAQRVARGKRAA